MLAKKGIDKQFQGLLRRVLSFEAEHKVKLNSSAVSAESYMSSTPGRKRQTLAQTPSVSSGVRKSELDISGRESKSNMKIDQVTPESRERAHRSIETQNTAPPQTFVIEEPVPANL